MNQNKEFPQILYSSSQDVRTKSLSLKPGYEYEIEISMNGQVSSEGFHSLSLEQRNCRLNHEVDKNSILKVYSQSNCKYECLVKKAFGMCQCIPWDFMHNLANASECDIFGRTCFFRAIESMKHEPISYCPDCIEDCDRFTYQTRIKSYRSLTLKDIGNGMMCDDKGYLCTFEKG